MTKNILLIGGAGFIGSAIAKELSSHKEYVVHVLEPERANISRLDAIKDIITIHQGDIRDAILIQDIIQNNKINVVIHLVSTLIPGSTLPHFQNEINDIISPTMKIMEICAKNKATFIFFSSGGTIYGNSETGIHTENDKKEPISYYGLSKSILEDMVLFENKHAGLEYLILRPSNPYGLGQNIYGKQGLIAVTIGKFIKKEPIVIWGDGKSTRDYIFIDDLAKIIYLLIENGIKNEIINIGSGIGYSVNDIIAFISNALDKEIEINYTESRGVDVDNLTLNISRLKSLIDFEPTPIQTGIKKFIKDLNL